MGSPMACRGLYTSTGQAERRGPTMSDTSALEAQLAFVEDAMRSLDNALAAQQQHIFKLEQQVDRLRQQLNEQGARLDAVAEPDNEPAPPHY